MDDRKEGIKDDSRDGIVQHTLVKSQQKHPNELQNRFSFKHQVSM